MEDRPYKEDGDVRTFTQDVGDFELVWHRDREDREISPLHPTDWKFQFDNNTPQTLLEGSLFIPKETYHRLIKGSGDLKLKVKKL
jgi:hypothetical protein